MSDIPTARVANELLEALAEQLAAQDQQIELVIVGGSALLATGVISRATSDVDVLALRSGDQLVAADPLPPALIAARDRVSRDFGLPALGG